MMKCSIRLLLVSLSILVLCNCGKQAHDTYVWPPPTPSEEHAKVLFIGVDAADWDNIDPMIQQGRIPNIAALKRDSAWGTQKSVSDNSPAIWTSIATGFLPQQHGIEAFTAENPDYDPNDSDSKRFLSVSSTMRKKKALWNILSEQGRTVGIVGWFATWPAEAVRGYMISSYASLDVNQGGEQLTGKGTFYADRPDLVYPPELGLGDSNTLRLFMEKGKNTALATTERVFAGYPEREGAKAWQINETKWAFAADDIFFQIGKRLLQEYPTDFFAIYLAGLDVIGHRFAGSLEDDEVLRRYYERVDEMIGELISVVPKDTVVVLASDHGTALPGPTHDYEGGIFLYRGRCVESGYCAMQSDSLDFLPTLLYLMGVPVPTQLPKKPMEMLFHDQWRRDNPTRFVEMTLDRKASAPPTGDSYRDEIFKRLSDLGYIGSDGQSKKLE
ncbi:MAG TPA: alkaline phosphatase family protein [bacterium]|nr:alkaline phosphatase family protein [bacterium]